MDKSCKDCIYYKEEVGYTMGQCKYPLPPYVSRTSFINETDADECPLYKSTVDVMEAAKHQQGES